MDFNIKEASEQLLNTLVVNDSDQYDFVEVIVEVTGNISHINYRWKEDSLIKSLLDNTERLLMVNTISDTNNALKLLGLKVHMAQVWFYDQQNNDVTPRDFPLEI